ncbi:hypothetical protein M5585_20780 [Serratia ureilytica]
MFGIGAVIGNFASGALTDALGSKFVLLFSVAIQTLSLFLLAFMSLPPGGCWPSFWSGASPAGCTWCRSSITCCRCRNALAR